MSVPAMRRGALPLVACALLASLPILGCSQPPRARPLDPDALLASVRAEREEAPVPEGRTLTLAEATALLRRANPAIREARATWQIADAVARTKTPPPNPTVSFGPLIFGGGNLLDMATVGYEAAVGWAIPTKNPPRLNDAVNRVRADAAFARVVAVEREAYLDLRTRMARVALGQLEQAVLAQLLDTATAATQAGRAMAEAGQGTSVDVRLLELELARVRAGSILVRGRATAAEREVAAHIGLAPSRAHLVGMALPPLPEALPALAEIEAAAIAGHPHLSVLRAEYVLAEKLLRQEAAKANPGLDIGAAFERTQPDNQLGLPLGIELPVFDQNQQGVAAAKAERDAVRARYRATLQRLLGDIATAHARIEARAEVLAAYRGAVGTATERAVEAARRGLDAGTVDALRFFATVRSQNEVALERFGARRELYEAWSALEQAAGVPLLDWPEATEAAPAAVDAAPAAKEAE